MNTKIAENIATIGMMAGSLLSEGKIEVEDSRELTDTIMDLGSIFEEKYGKIVEETEDYIGYIDFFAQKELLKKYGIEDLVLLGIYHTQKDKTMSGADIFMIDENGIESITDGNVASISEPLYQACHSILQEKGYEIVNSFIYYEDHVLHFEIKKIN